MSFIASLQAPENDAGSGYLFVFRKDRLRVSDENGHLTIPRSREAMYPSGDYPETHFFGWWNAVPCYFAEEHADRTPNDSSSYQPIRSLVPLLSTEALLVAGRAFHLLNWERTSRYCGRCGASMERLSDERAKRCLECGLIVYPRISPAVIVAVVKDDKLLLASNGKIPGKRYSVLAGFVEPGETLEECVSREVKEESGIDVCDIRYFASQPWPFPDSLMVGFTARYAAGDLKIDEKELTDAGWYRADALPNIPGPFSISRALIDWFVGEQESGDKMMKDEK